MIKATQGSVSMEAQWFVNSGTRVGNGWPLNRHFQRNRKAAHSVTLSMPSRRRVVSRRRLTVTAAAVAEANKSATKAETPVRIVAIVGEGSISPLKSTPWEEVMLHTVSTHSQSLDLLSFLHFSLNFFNFRLENPVFC